MFTFRHPFLRNKIWGNSINADSGPLGYVLLCCDSSSQDFFNFIQIGSGHTVRLFVLSLFFVSFDLSFWLKTRKILKPEF